MLGLTPLTRFQFSMTYMYTRYLDFLIYRYKTWRKLALGLQWTRPIARRLRSQDTPPADQRHMYSPYRV